VSTGEVLVSWQPVQKASAYEMERCEGAALTTCAMKTTPRITAGQPLQVRDNLIASGTYLYRVTAYGSKQLPIAQGQVGYVYTAPLTVVLMPAPSGTITPIPAGPSSLTAESSIPGQIQLRWQEVANASGYRVTRSSTAPEAETKLVEYSSTSQPAGGNWPHTDAPVDDRWTFSYKVYALFGTTVSTPSPVASAKSIAVIQPTGLKYGVTLIPTPGRVNVTLSWTGVPNVATYMMPGADFIGMPTITTTGTSHTLNNLPASHTYPVCVGAVYPYSLGDPDTAPCVDIKLS
jgi:hypothetical protein